MAASITISVARTKLGAGTTITAAHAISPGALTLASIRAALTVLHFVQNPLGIDSLGNWRECRRRSEAYAEGERGCSRRSHKKVSHWVYSRFACVSLAGSKPQVRVT